MTTPKISDLPMPFGAHRGKLISTLPLPYLAWFISQDALRLKHSKLTCAMLAEVRFRLQDTNRAEAELSILDGSDLV